MKNEWRRWNLYILNENKLTKNRLGVKKLKKMKPDRETLISKVRNKNFKKLNHTHTHESWYQWVLLDRVDFSREINATQKKLHHISISIFLLFLFCIIFNLNYFHVFSIGLDCDVWSNLYRALWLCVTFFRTQCVHIAYRKEDEKTIPR